MSKGKIIFLNGVSSSGKSTLAKTLQARLSEPFYLLANDTFCNMSPEKFFDINATETFDRALKGLYYTIKTFSDVFVKKKVQRMVTEKSSSAGV